MRAHKLAPYLSCFTKVVGQCLLRQSVWVHERPGVWFRSGLALHCLNSQRESLESHLEDLTLLLPYTCVTQLCAWPLCALRELELSQTAIRHQKPAILVVRPGLWIHLAACIEAARTVNIRVTTADWRKRLWCGICVQVSAPSYSKSQVLETRLHC